MGDCLEYFPDQPWSFGDNIAGPCSGNGECINGTCVCFEGWTGLSDFINAEGYDCQINILGYKITWAILLAIQVYAIVKSYPYLKSRYQTYKELAEGKRKKGEKYGLTQNIGALSMVIWYGIGAPSIIVTCIIKLAMNGERVGVTPLMTFLFIWNKFIFYACMTLFQPSLLNAVVNGMKDTLQYVKINKHMTYVVFVGQVLAGFMAVGVLANATLGAPMYLTYLFLMTLNTAFVFFQGVYIKHELSKTLDMSYSMAKSEKTLVMKKKLRKMQNGAIKPALVVTIIYLFQFVWPFMWTKHDYFLAISWIVFAVMGLRTAKTSISEKDSRRLSASQKSSLAAAKANSADTGENTNETSEQSEKGLGSEIALSFAQNLDEYEPETVGSTNSTV